MQQLSAKHPTHDARIPSLVDLGPDLLILGAARRWFSLALPFAFVAGYFYLAFNGYWPLAVLCAAAYTFCSYGSTSHDLLHGTLGLPHWLNHMLLSLVELLGVRSGHAYRAAHLHHHARFPHDDDIEATAAHGTFWGALASGPWHQPKVWFWAVRHSRHDRVWIWGEGIACVILVAGSVAAYYTTSVPLIYALLVTAASWTFPLFTAYLPHDPNGETELFQARRFRGKVLNVLFLRHLYHLEHHLYPHVPHHHWRKLAERLDPYFDSAGVESEYLLLPHPKFKRTQRRQECN